MNYLEIVQEAHRYIGGGNQLPAPNTPSTVVGQTGYFYDLVKSAAAAYKDIQREQDKWAFMQKQTSFVILTGQRTITQAAMVVQIPDYETLMPDTVNGGYRFLIIYSTADGVQDSSICTYVPYQQWRGVVDYSVIPTGKPYLYTIQPNGTIEFNTVTDKPYTMVCDYYQKVIEWVQVDVGPVLADQQTPIFPSRFHEAVVWRTVNYWGGTVQNTGAFGRSGAEYERIMNELRSECLPEMLLDLSAYTRRGYGIFW